MKQELIILAAGKLNSTVLNYAVCFELFYSTVTWKSHSVVTGQSLLSFFKTMIKKFCFQIMGTHLF